MAEWTLPLLAAAGWFEEDPPIPRAQGIDLAVGRPALDTVDPIQRRRLSRLARGALHCALRVAPPGDLRLVYASRHGESDRTIGLLRDLASGVDVSPAAFSMSVHNAVPGLLSILAGNRAPISAVAAGSESFGYGLLAAAAAWKADPAQQVLFLYGEDRLPELWAPFVPEVPPHALALLLGAGGRDLVLAWDPERRGSEPGNLQSLHFFGRLAQVSGLGPWTGPTGAWDWRLA